MINADVRNLLHDAENGGALFQVASQFNLLKMTDPSVTPEDGVSRSEWDNTQGPICTIAAGAATVYRNYFAPVGDQIGHSSVATSTWEPLARLVLEATYEATLHCAALNAVSVGSRRVFLTLVGAGVFGNPRSWVLDAMRRSLNLFHELDLAVAVVSPGSAPDDLQILAAEGGPGA